MRDFLRKSAEKLLDFVYPQGLYCAICGNFIDSTRSYCLCDHCTGHIEWGNIKIDPAEQTGSFQSSQGLDSIRSCFGYGLYARRLIFELKYNDHGYVARTLARIAIDRICGDPKAAEVLSCDFASCVPLSTAKLKKRGFNQAEKIAKYFCVETGMRCEKDLLRRVRDTEALRSLSPRERAEELCGAFAINRSKAKLLRDKRILLIDDIYTTGATMAGCARVLKEAGAKEVHALVLASASRPTEGAFDYNSYNWANSAGDRTGG